MLAQLFPALRATVVLAALTGIAFPLAVTGIAQAAWPDQAKGSLIRNEAGAVVGSRLIGQTFTKPQYFHSRPSAAGGGYGGEASSGTNLGPTSAKLLDGIADDPATKDANEGYDGVKQLTAAYRAENGLAADAKVPVDAVTRSSSGLDPHISLANAELQVPRVAKARALPEATVREAVRRYVDGRDLGILGEPGVNVLALNLALDRLTRP
jgi:K+-transporting ATPase ATPase C chain